MNPWQGWRRQTALAAVSAALLWSALHCGPDLSQFQALRRPRLTHKPPMRMLVAELRGAPAQTVGRAFGVLYKLRYSLDEPDHNLKKEESSPRARWPVSLETPPEEWTGLFAVPVSNHIESLPPEAAASEPPVRLETWQYGLVAEILHIGPYDREPASVAKLMEFIRKKGCRVSGLHEEEYLKGPGMIFKGDPEEYQTILRYPITCPRPQP